MGKTVRNLIRLFIAPWYLLGWLSHVYLALMSPDTYWIFGDTALFPGFADFWFNVVMPNIVLFALLLAAFELSVGCLLIGKGKWVKAGLTLSILFNLFLVQLGLSYPAADWQSDFLVNRLSNLIFVALQVPLLWGWDEQTLPEAIRGWFYKKIETD